jgi:rubrerythrin
MDDAYRTSAFACPACGSPNVRPFGDRVICDDCAGMLIGEDDFQQAMFELDQKAYGYEYGGATGTDKACPSCTRPMTQQSVQLGRYTLPDETLRCDRHGMWIPQEAMTSLFARANRKGGFGSSQGRRGGRGGAQVELAITKWWNDKPRVHTLYVSAYKDRTLACAVCDGRPALAYQGDRWSCRQCHGLFVETAAFIAMVSEMTTAPYELPEPTGAPSDRQCPLCSEPMTTEHGIECCAAHGFWFDENELASTLHEAAQPASAPRGWLRRLFRGDE